MENTTQQTLMHKAIEKLSLIFFVIVLSGFTIVHHDEMIIFISVIITIIILLPLCFFLPYKYINKSINGIEVKLLNYSSIFYLLYDQSRSVILVDGRHEVILDLLEEEDLEILLKNILERFAIRDSNIQNILSSLHQDFEMSLDYELKNIIKSNFSVKNFQVVNLVNTYPLKSRLNGKATAISVLMIVNNQQEDLAELCNHYKFPLATINDRGQKLYMNQHCNHLKSVIDLNLVFKSISSLSCSSNKQSAAQSNFLYTNKNGENLNVYKLANLFWNFKSGMLEEYFNLIITKTNQNEQGQNYFWDLYCRNNSIPIAQLNSDFEIIESNHAFDNLVRFDEEKGIELIDYLETEESDFESRLEFENSIVMHVLFKFNKRNSAFAYIQKISYFNEIIVYLIDNTRQRDLELNAIHSQKMQAIGQLAGGIAHDFNNLLTGMLGFCDLLLQKHTAGDQSFPELIQIKQNIVRAIKLVKNLLAFSRKQVFDIAIVDVNEVIMNISDLLRRLIGENITLKTSFNQANGFIKIDRGQLEQVITNLVVNARDAADNCGQIQIRTSQISVTNGYPNIKSKLPLINLENDIAQDGHYILVEIEDNGSGIPEELQSKIFEPFYSTKEIGAGTGLGLSMVYGIVKQSDGYIYFSTKQNHGSIFYILLRKVESIQKEEQSDQYLEKPLPEPFLQSKNEITVLLIEDEDSVRAFLVYALESNGYKVLEAESGQVAIKVIQNKKHKLDLVITDVIMPGMNGYQAVEQIKQITRNNELKVLFISGYTENKIVQELKANNDNYSFLSKPFDLKELTSKVREILD